MNSQRRGLTRGLTSDGTTREPTGGRIVRGLRALVMGGVASLVLVLTVAAVPASAQQSELAGLTLPPVDPELAFVAPSADQPNYAARLQVFLQATVPDMWNGQPVQFLSTYTSSDGVDVLGLPTSEPKADPNNPNFVYQRFENGVLFYNATEGSTQALPLV